MAEFDFCVSMHHHIWVLLGRAWCKLFSAVFITLFALHVSDVIHIHPQEQLESRRAVEQVNLHVHLPVPSACTFYIAPEDGYVLHPKHVEQIV